MTRGRLARCAAALLLFVTAAPACGGPSGGSVRVLVPWTSDAELAPFRKVADLFEKEELDKLHPIRVRFVRTRAIRQSLEKSVRDGNPPDLAVVPTPGVLRDYALLKLVQPLDRVLGPDLQRQYGTTWLGFGSVGTDHQYGVVVKANVKSLIWYNRPSFAWRPPGTWSELLETTASIVREKKGPPWCMAMADPPNSGWPGTDWLEDILLHQAGPEIYARFAEGTQEWRSKPVKEAWRTWSKLLADAQIRGGRLSALLLRRNESDAPLFSSPPGCRLAHGAVARVPEHGTGDPDFFPFPAFESSGRSRQSYEVSADLLAMFRQSPEAEAFVKFLAGAQAQGVWPALDRDGAFTPNLTVLQRRLDSEDKGSVGSRVAKSLVSGRPLCFDASDWMPDTMANAFYRAVLEYLHDTSDDRLDAILQGLDDVRSSVYGAAPITRGTVCGPAARLPQ